MFPPWEIPANAKWLDVNSYPITYQDVGRGPAIVLVHGSLVDYRIWEPTITGLAMRFRVIAPSLRHHYPEPWSGIGDDFTIEQQAADLERLIAALEVSPVHLLGWSRGALVAVELARRSPELVRTLIFEDATVSIAGGETEASRRAKTAADARLSALKSAIQRGEYERGAQELVDALNGPGAWARMPAARRQMMLDNIRTSLADVRPPVPQEVLAALAMPMLLLTGENSPKSYAEFYEALRKLRECGPTVVISNAAHLMHLDNPDAFNQAVAAFVSAH